MLTLARSCSLARVGKAEFCLNVLRNASICGSRAPKKQKKSGCPKPGESGCNLKSGGENSNVCAKGKEPKPECYRISRKPVCGEGLVESVCDDDFTPRFDWMFYRPTDKASRTYQKTWVDCPDRPRYPLLCGPAPIPWEKRITCSAGPGGNFDKSACELNKNKFQKICYQKNVNCEEGRRPPSCTKHKKPSGCHKYCCPYPSFSECLMTQICKEPSGSPECRCLAIPSQCEINAWLQKMHK